MFAKLNITCLVFVSLFNSLICQTTTCDGNNGEVFPHENDCTLYYICADGYKYQLSCLNGQHFSPITLRCESPETALCDPAFSTTISTPSVTGPTLPTTPSPTIPTDSTLSPNDTETPGSDTTITFTTPSVTGPTLPTTPAPTLPSTATPTGTESDTTITVPTVGTAPPPTVPTAPPTTVTTDEPTTTDSSSTEETLMPDETEEEADEADGPPFNEVFDPEDFLIPL